MPSPDPRDPQPMPRPPPAPLTPQPPCWAWRTGWTVAPGQTAAGGQRQRGGPINSVAGVGGEVGRAQLGHPPPLASRTRRWQRGDRPHVSRAAVRLATVSLGALVPVPEPQKQGAQGWQQHGKWPLCLLPWRRPGAPGRAPWRARPPWGTRALPGPGEAPAEKPRFPGPESGVTVSQRGGELDVSG